MCRTDLHLAEGDLRPREHLVVPGHEVVGVVDQRGPGCARFRDGDRVGIPWLAQTCGTCRFGISERDKNLCLSPQTFTSSTSTEVYADYAVVDERYAYAIPDSFNDQDAAPLLCAGIIGYRSLSVRSYPREAARG